MKKTLLIISTFLCSFTLVAQDIETGLVARYSFCGNLEDQSGNGNHGIYMGPSQPVYAPDHHGNADRAILLNGIFDWVKVEPSATMNAPDQAVTVSAWVNYLSLAFGSWAPVFAKTDQPTLASRSYSMGINGSTGQIYWHSTYVGQAPLEMNTWYHIVITYTPELLQCYLNGELIGEEVPVDPMTPNEEPFEIGRDTPQSTDYFHGTIDEVNIFTRVLSAADVLALYNYDECGASAVGDFQWSGDVKVYPNPVTDFLKLDFEGLPVDRTILIFNALGQLVVQQFSRENAIDIAMSALPKGVFQLQIKSVEGIYTQKLLK